MHFWWAVALGPFQFQIGGNVGLQEFLFALFVARFFFTWSEGQSNFALYCKLARAVVNSFTGYEDL